MLAGALLVWIGISLPLALGWQTLYFRDVFNHFLPFKSFGVAELLAGRIPAINPTVGLGQPYRGDPGNLGLYPGNVLFLVFPFWSALNLHYVLHWLLSFFTFRLLASRLGLGAAAASFAALTWAGSGWMLSNLSFHNLLVVAAWWPLVLAGGVVGGRRGIALGGLACGLALLGGEPVTATLGLLPLVWLTVSRWGWRRGLATAVAVGAVGLVVALPQLVATWRIMGFSQRVLWGVPPAGGYALYLPRLLELLVPIPFGTPDGLGTERFWAGGVLSRPPFVLSLHLGVVALALALSGARRRAAWVVPALLGLLLAWIGGLVPDALTRISSGLFRFPEKFLLWFALFVPLLAGAGLEGVRSGLRGSPEDDAVSPEPSLGASSGGAAGTVPALGLLALVVLGFVLVTGGLGPAAVAWLSPGLSETETARLATEWVPRWIGALVVSALLLGGAVVAVRRRSVPALLLLQLLALLPLLGLVPRDRTAPYRQPPPWARGLERGTEVVSIPHTALFPRPGRGYRLPPGADRATWRRIRHLDLDFPTGVRAGLSYPLGPDAVGLHSPLMYVLYRRVGLLDDPALQRWMRVLGVERVVRSSPPDGPGWRVLDRVTRFGVPTLLTTVERPAPRVWWPDEVTPMAGSRETFEQVTGAADPIRHVAIAGDVLHTPGARVELLEEGPDRLVAEVRGRGGILVLRRSFHPIYRAVSGDRRLRTLPVNLVLLGVHVPAGTHRVVVEVTSWPEVVAAVVAAAVALLALLVIWRGRVVVPFWHERRGDPG